MSNANLARNEGVSMARQSCGHILLIEPAVFYANPETMETNVYQVNGGETSDEILKKALSEFNGFRDMLADNGIEVTVVKGDARCPDHIFPNWMSTHEGGGMVIYPMYNQNRQWERTPEMIAKLSETYDTWHDLSSWEKEGKIIESTGSMVLDRVNKIVYAGLSRRTTREAVEDWCDLMGYEPVIFETVNQRGNPVYHTDLVIFIGTEVVGVASESIADHDRERVLARLSEHRDIVELTAKQQQSFCGNSLEVTSDSGDRMLVMSDKAFGALTEEQKETFGQYFSRILHAPLTTIEAYGGGSARCLMCEMF